MQAPLKQHAHNVLIIAILPTPYERGGGGWEGAYWYNRLPDLMAREMNNYEMACFILLEINTIFYREDDNDHRHHILWFSLWEWGELCCTVWFHSFIHVCKKMWNSWLEFFSLLFKCDIRHSIKDHVQPSNSVLYKGAHIMHLVLILLSSKAFITCLLLTESIYFTIVISREEEWFSDWWMKINVIYGRSYAFNIYISWWWDEQWHKA